MLRINRTRKQTRSDLFYFICVIMSTVDCTCKVSIPLHDDIDSHGCNGGWVGQLGMPAMATVSSQCGQFNGYDSALNNGAHLGTFVIDGAFAGDWVHSLKWTATFTIDSTAWTAHKTAINPTIAKWGVVTYGDCAAGAAMAFHVEDDGADNTGLVATVETKDEDNNLNKYTLACSVSSISIQLSSDVGLHYIFTLETVAYTYCPSVILLTFK